MPARTIKLKKGYIEDLMNNYNDCTELHELAKKIPKMCVNTLKTMNKGGSISVNSTKKIADYFGIQERYIENSILTEEEAKEFLRKKSKKYDIPQIMTQAHVAQSHVEMATILKPAMSDPLWDNDSPKCPDC